MSWFGSLVDMLLPRYCKVCGHRLCMGEEHLCISCMIDMPRLKFGQKDLNLTERLLLSVRSLVRAESMFRYYKESDYSRILYHLKYYGHPDVGDYLAHMAAIDLKESGFFNGIDYIVPVPLSARKYRKRGYNQCAYLAKGLSDVSGLPIREDVVKRMVANSQQAGKGRFQRWENAEGIFQVTDVNAFRGRHILLVDDVITTGATITSMASAICECVDDVRVSVFTLGIAL